MHADLQGFMALEEYWDIRFTGLCWWECEAIMSPTLPAQRRPRARMRHVLSQFDVQFDVRHSMRNQWAPTHFRNSADLEPFTLCFLLVLS